MYRSAGLDHAVSSALAQSEDTAKTPRDTHILKAGFSHGAVIFALVVAALAEAYSSGRVGIVRRGTVCRV
jgi:hypothetical protein